MLYLSKGIVCPESAIRNLFLEKGKQKFQIQGGEAAVWLRGRFEFAVTVSEAEEQAVIHLTEKGLAEMEEETNSLSKYRILTRCVCCSAKQNGRMSVRLSDLERQLYTWIQKAGIHLSAAELVFLTEHRIVANREMLYERNR